VTGATGFVGLNLMEALVRAGGWRVLAVARPGSNRIQAMHEYLPSEVASQIEVVEADLNQNRSLERSLDHVPNVNVIFHLMHAKDTTVKAGRRWAPMGHTPEGGEEHIQLNLEAMDQVLDIAADKQVDRVVYCSSWSSYGIQPAGTMVDEFSTSRLASKPIALGFFGTNAHPIPYAIAKHKCELRLKEAIDSKRIKGGVIIQPCSIFGPYSQDAWSSFFGRLLKSDGKIPGLPGTSSFVEARDLATVFITATTNGDGKGECYVIGGTNATNLTMMQTMADLVGVAGPKSATNTTLLMGLARWNELCLGVLPVWLLPYFQIKANTIACPLLVAKLCQSQGTHSCLAQEILGYRPRPLLEVLKGNYDWLVGIGVLPSRR
jgi:dihydroflavonol-4-reductase